MLTSLQMRLAIGAAVMATVALAAAALVIWSGNATRQQLAAALATERRIDMMSGLASRVSSYGLLSLEASRQAGPVPALVARLEDEAAVIARQFDALDAAFSDAVSNPSTTFDDRTRIATRSMGVARMRSSFARLSDVVTEDPKSPRRENELELFAAGFSPYLNATIEEEYRIRTAAFDRIERLRQASFAAAAALGTAAVALFALFLAGVVRPVFRRLDALLGASRRIAVGDLDVALPEGGRDEFAPLYDETRALARRLRDERVQVTADRARLNEIVDARTAQLSEANSRLAAIDADRRRFFADLSHELRTPLTVILMEAELAQRGGDARTAFGVILQRAGRLTRRIDDMLRVARSTSGRIELEPQRIDLAAIAAAAVEDAGRAADLARVTCDLQASEPVEVLADRNWTRQLLEGLIENALRHAGGGGRIRSVVDTVPEGGRVRVIDNGPGVSGDPEAVFRRFERGAESGAHGFGIGLALARWIVDEQGGSIVIESPVVEGRLGDAPGTCVTMILPQPDPDA